MVLVVRLQAIALAKMRDMAAIRGDNVTLKRGAIAIFFEISSTWPITRIRLSGSSSELVEPLPSAHLPSEVCHSPAGQTPLTPLLRKPHKT